VWSDDDGELFERLKSIARRMMADIAARCDARFQTMCLEPGGPDLLAFGADLDLDGHDGMRRQDHPEVGCCSGLVIVCLWRA
jgi:hypothetical protein